MMKIPKSQFMEYMRTLEEPSWFEEYRKRQYELYLTAKYPPFRYGLNILVKPAFNFSHLSIPSRAKIVKKLAFPKDHVEVISGSRMEYDALWVKDLIGEEWMEHELNSLHYFNQAFCNDIILIRIPRDSILDQPIIIDYSIAEDLLISNIFILVEENAKAKIFLHRRGKCAGYVADTIRILCREGSGVKLLSIQDLAESAINIQHRQSRGMKDSSAEWTDVAIGSVYTRSLIKTRLEESGAESKTTVLYITKNKQMFDICTASEHEAPKTMFHSITKGVIGGCSKALSRGLIKIAKEAAGSIGYEKQEALLVSETAEADAIPNLVIHNHDVKCGHSSSVGPIDQEKLFYLMSRGLTEQQGKRQIVQGFFEPVLKLYQDKDFKESVFTAIEGSIA